MQICDKIKIKFVNEMEQHRALVKSPLANYIPWQCIPIERDGNCFFRCISHIISGIQDNYELIRGEVCRFIVTEGREFIQKYLQTKFYKDTSPLTYLKESAMTQYGIWASDVEIIAVSRMLNTSVFVAMKKDSPGDDWRRIEWLRYCGCQNP